MTSYSEAPTFTAREHALRASLMLELAAEADRQVDDLDPADRAQINASVFNAAQKARVMGAQAHALAALALVATEDERP